MKRICYFFLTTVTTAMLLVGCDTLLPKTPPAPAPANPAPAPDPEPPTPTPVQIEIDRLLFEGRAAFNDNRLTTPVDDNALLRYLRVLRLEPANADARRGIDDIVEKYLAWAIENAENGNLRLADRYLESAAAVDERHPGIESVTQLLADTRESNRDLYTLSARALANRASSTVKELERLGRLAEERDALVIISARNDAEGRWIYQQMNDATELRVRARLQLRNRPSVRMIYQETADPDS